MMLSEPVLEVEVVSTTTNISTSLGKLLNAPTTLDIEIVQIQLLTHPVVHVVSVVAVQVRNVHDL